MKLLWSYLVNLFEPRVCDEEYRLSAPFCSTEMDCLIGVESHGIWKCLACGDFDSAWGAFREIEFFHVTTCTR